MTKRRVKSFAFGIVLMVLALFGYVALVSIWNRTVNIADRKWYFSGRTLTSAEMRAISIALLEEDPQRPIQQICINPDSSPNGYTGALVDETQGLTKVVDTAPVLFGNDDGSDTAESMFTDELACMAVFPHTLNVAHYMQYILFSTFDPSNWN